MTLTIGYCQHENGIVWSLIDQNAEGDDRIVAVGGWKSPGPRKASGAAKQLHTSDWERLARTHKEVRRALRKAGLSWSKANTTPWGYSSWPAGGVAPEGAIFTW